MTDTNDFLQAVREIEPVLRQQAATAEQDRRLAEPAAAAMKATGLYRLWRPKALGGFEADPVTAFQVIEELGRIDSAASWNLQVSIAHDLFGPWFGDHAAREIFGGANAIAVGAFNPMRLARPADGGYLVSGTTPFVSGVHQATVILGFATVQDGDKPRQGPDGVPEVLLTACPAGQATIVDHWNTMGMRGTGSHDVELREVFLPEHWTAPWRPLQRPGTAYEGALYRLTIWPAIAALVPPALGIARAAIDEALELIGRKTPAYGAKTLRDRGVVQTQLAQAEARLGAGRAYFYGIFGDAWQQAMAARPITLELKARMQLAMTHAVLEAAAAVDLVHEIAGASGVREEYGFAQHFRDIHVITQHGFINAGKLESVGQIMLGLEPEWPFFRF